MWSGGWQQWPLQQAMYQNMPHDQVDWAALAKQWIEMQHVPSSDGNLTTPPPPAPATPQIPNTEPVVPVNNSLDPFRAATNTLAVISKVPEATATPVPMDVVQTEVPFKPTDANAPTNYWNNNWDGSAGPPIAGWTAPPTEKDPFQFGDSMHGNLPSYDYNHGSDPYTHPQNFVAEPPYVPYWSAPETIPPFMRKEGRQMDDHSLIPGDEFSQMDAAKRKQLPPWIREGLEKMERDRQRQQEKERMKQAYEEKRAGQRGSLSSQSHDGNKDAISVTQKSKFDSDSDDDDKLNSANSPAPTSVAVSPIRVLTEEELMLRVRQMLTEILLEVTNEEILAVSKEVHQRARFKAPAQQLATSSALASITGILGGLAAYGSGVSDDEDEVDEHGNGSSYEDSDAELERIILEKKRAFAEKEVQIVAMLEDEARNSKKEKEKAMNIKEENLLSEEPANQPLSPESNQERSEIPEVVDRPVLKPRLSKSWSYSGSSSSTSSSSSDSESDSSESSRSTLEMKKQDHREDTKALLKKEEDSKRSSDVKNRAEKKAINQDLRKNKKRESRSRSSSIRRSKQSRSRSREGKKSKRGNSKEKRNSRKYSRNKSSSKDRTNRSRDSRSHSRDKKNKYRSHSRDKRSRSRDKQNRSRIRQSQNRDKRSHSREKRSHSREKRSCSREKRSRSRSKEKRSCSREKRSQSREKQSRSKEKQGRSREKRSYSREIRSPSGEKRSNSREKRNHNREKRSRSRENRSHSREERSLSREKQNQKLRSASAEPKRKSKLNESQDVGIVNKEGKKKRKWSDSTDEGSKTKRRSRSVSQERTNKKSKENSKKSSRKQKSRSRTPTKEIKKSHSLKESKEKFKRRSSPIRSKRRRSRSSSYESTRSGKKSSGKNKHR